MKDEPLCEENWEAVLNVAGVQGWLGVTVMVLVGAACGRMKHGRRRCGGRRGRGSNRVGLGREGDESFIDPSMKQML